MRDQGLKESVGRLFSTGMVALLFSAFVFSGASEAGKLSLNATFLHQDEDSEAQYQSILSSVNPYWFDDQPGKTVLNISPGDCFSITSWVVGLNAPQTVGPVTACLAPSEVSVQELNDWLRQDEGDEMAPDLGIPLVLDPNSPPDHWTNPIPVAGQLFVKACGDESFSHYGNLLFEEGSISVVSEVDAKGERLLDVDIQGAVFEAGQTSWQAIRDQCDEDQILPEASLAGLSEVFFGTTKLTPPDPDTWSGGIRQVRDQIEMLSYQGDLGEIKADQLLRTLDRALDALRKAKLNQVIHWLNKFALNVDKLVRRGLIDPKTASILTIPVEDIRNEIADRDALSVQSDPAFYCEENTDSCSDESCFPGTFYVDKASTDPAPDGNPSRPFVTLSDALNAAESTGLCGVFIFIAPGHYAEGEINVSLNTYVVARETGSVVINGSFVNHGPYLLELRGIGLIGGGVVTTGAIDVDHACASTRLEDVSITRFRGHGVRQRGGSANLIRTIISKTVNDSTSLTSGTALKVGCGASVGLVDVILWSNDSAGLAGHGEGTSILAIDLGVSANGPAVLVDSLGISYQWGALYVGNGASFTGRSIYVMHNRMQVGILSADGSINIDGGIVFVTRALPLSVPSELGQGGMGVSAVGRDSQVRMQNFRISHSALCGVQVADFGNMVLADGVISDNEIGACVQVPGYPLSLLQNRIVYRDNVANIEATSFPTPTPTEVIIDN